MATKKSNRSVKAAATVSRRYSTASLIGLDDPDVLCIRVTGLVTRDVATAITSDVGGLLKSQQLKGVVWVFDTAVLTMDPGEMAQVTDLVSRQCGRAFKVLGCVVHAEMWAWFDDYASRCANLGICCAPFLALWDAVHWAIEQADAMSSFDRRYTWSEHAARDALRRQRGHLAADRVARLGM